MDWVSGWLANVEGLWLVAGVPVLGALALWYWLRRRWSWRMLGKAPSGSARRWWRFLLISVGLLMTGVAAARPFWGREDAAVAGAARDLVVVLDLSRSMLAESPSRQMRAQRVLTDLADTLKQRGGHRIALVVFAAHAQAVMPLTTDYDLFQSAVLAQNAAKLPAELRVDKDGSDSGTRLGAGLRQAVAAHDSDPVYRGSQLILLISDGDDPADDGEWKSGIIAARRANIPVFVIGIGDPDKASRIRIGDNTMTFGDVPVETILNEALLREIAQQSDGTYFPVHTDKVASGSLFQAILESAATRPRETAPAEDVHERFRWFLIPGLLMLGASILIPDRKIVYLPRRWTKEGGRWTAQEDVSCGSKANRGNVQEKLGKSRRGLQKMSTTVAFAMFAILCTAAVSFDDDPLRRGNEAFQRKDYAAALELYEQAEERADDPGLVSFNKGAALSRLGRSREAELCYLRCLQDVAVPATRRTKALYDLGLLLLQRGAERKDLEALVRAGDCFARCRKEPSGDAAMRDDAEHNLELTRWLFQRVRAELMLANNKAPFPQEPPGGAKAFPDKNDFGSGDPKGKNLLADQGEPGKQGATAETEEKLPGSGNVRTLPDADRLQTLDPNDARELLARAIQRIERERDQALGSTTITNPNFKDW